MASYLLALNLFLRGIVQIRVIEGRGNKEFLRQINLLKNPRIILRVSAKALSNKTTVYVCGKGRCSEPITEFRKLKKVITTFG